HQAGSKLQQGDPASASKLIQRGMGLWRGEPLADFAYEAFARREIDRLSELRLQGLELRIESELAQGSGSDLVGELRTLVAEHPLSERLRAHLMLALYRAGRQADSLQAYQEARQALADELGIDPGPEL